MPRDSRHFLEDIERSCEAVLRYSEGQTREALLADPKTRDAVERHLFILGEAVNHVDPAVVEQNPDVPWREIVGLTSALAHGYWRIDEDVPWDSVTNGVPELLSKVRRIRGSD